MPTVQGASVAQTAELRLEVPTGMTLDALWRRFVSPLAVLLTLAVDTYWPPVGVDVYSQEEERWLEVRRPELKEPADGLLGVHNVLLTRLDLGVGHLAAWLDAAPALRPIPSLVAEVATALGRTLANQLLEMAIAAEGLHRPLRPNDRVMSLGQAAKARRLGRDAVPPEHSEIRKRVNDALLHLEEPTYAERLHFLTDLVGEAVPGATGDTEQWESRTKAVRNGFAHQVVPPADDGEWHEYFVLLRTLRWVLTGALLLQTGLEPALLGERLQQYEPYRFLLRQAQLWLPDLYAAYRRPPADTNGALERSP
jgi:Apea-like HEPN